MPAQKKKPQALGKTPGAKRKPLRTSRDSLASAGAKHCLAALTLSDKPLRQRFPAVAGDAAMLR